MQELGFPSQTPLLLVMLLSNALCMCAKMVGPFVCAGAGLPKPDAAAARDAVVAVVKAVFGGRHGALAMSSMQVLNYQEGLLRGCDRSAKLLRFCVIALSNGHVSVQMWISHEGLLRGCSRPVVLLRICVIALSNGHVYYAGVS